MWPAIFKCRRKSILRQKYIFPHRDPGIEASETSAAAAVQEFAERDCQAETDMGTEEANLHFPRRVSQISLADRGAGMQGSFPQDLVNTQIKINLFLGNFSQLILSFRLSFQTININ